MQVYKFVDSKDYKKVLDGSVIFSKLSYFRVMEARYEKAWIGDMGEGTAVTYIENVVSTSEDDPIRNHLSNLGLLNVSGVGKLVIQNSTSIRQMDAYVLSFSWGKFSKLKNAMCSGRQDNSYDACVKIPNVNKLKKAIWQHGKYQSFSSNDKSFRKISDDFRLIDSGIVTYGSNITTLTRSGYKDPTPYIKDVSFSDQSEFRLIMTPCSVSSPNRIIVSFPNINSLIVGVSISKIKNRKISYYDDVLDIQKIFNRVKEINSFLRSIWEEELSINVLKELIKLYWEAMLVNFKSVSVEQSITKKNLFVKDKVYTGQLRSISSSFLFDLARFLYIDSSSLSF